MADWYFKDASETPDYAWENPQHWWPNSDASGDSPYVAPWTTFDTAYLGDNLHLATDAAPPVIGIESTISSYAYGVCDILGVINNGNVYGGSFSGYGFTNCGFVNGGIFTGPSFLNWSFITDGFFRGSYFSNSYPSEIHGGTFVGDRFSNYATIYGGTFTGNYFLNGGTISGGFFAGHDTVANSGTVQDGIFLLPPQNGPGGSIYGMHGIGDYQWSPRTTWWWNDATSDGLWETAANWSSSPDGNGSSPEVAPWTSGGPTDCDLRQGLNSAYFPTINSTIGIGCSGICSMSAVAVSALGCVAGGAWNVGFLTNSGIISDGVFQQSVLNSEGTINGGFFCGGCNNSANGEINGGTFGGGSGTWSNADGSAGVFGGVVTSDGPYNYGTITSWGYTGNPASILNSGTILETLFLGTGGSGSGTDILGAGML